jgi:hypothetical protein
VPRALLYAAVASLAPNRFVMEATKRPVLPVRPRRFFSFFQAPFIERAFFLISVKAAEKFIKSLPLTTYIHQH